VEVEVGVEVEVKVEGGGGGDLGADWEVYLGKIQKATLQRRLIYNAQGVRGEV
jgi:hypothetical protein